MASASARPRDNACLDWINDCMEQANAYRAPFEPGWQENWANYRVESTYNAGFPSKQYPLAPGGAGRFGLSPINFLKTPESHQGVNTLRSLLLAGLFGTRDYIQADPVGDEDIDKAKRVSRLIMYGLERPGNFRTNFEILGDSLIFGLGSYSSRWKTVTRLVPRRMPVPDPVMPGQFVRNPDSGAIMTVLKMMEAPVFNDPVNETDELLDTWFDPSANRFADAKYKIKRFQMSRDELQAILDSGDKNWDLEGIQNVLLTEPTGRAVGLDRTDEPKLITENLTQEDIAEVKAYGFYGGWMFDGQVPTETAQEIGEIDAHGTVVLRMINGICIQAIQSPQRDGLLQGGAITILPTGRGLYGLSPLTVVRYLQDVSDTQLILTVQALIESVYQNYLIGGDLGPNLKRDLETRRAREVFQLQGEVDQVVPLPKDYSGLQIAVGALQLISQTMRNAMNARDPVQGIMKQSGEQTATESQIVASSALQNTDQLAVLIERDELPLMGRLINDLYYVNIDDEAKIFRRVGESETTNVSYYDIDSVTDINFVGARSLLTRQAKSNQFRDFAAIMASNPLTMAMTDWVGLVQRWGDEGFDVKGLERLMLTDPEEIVARMQALGLAKNPTAGADTGGAGPDGGAPQSKVRRMPGNGGRLGGLNPAQAAGEAS